MGNNHRFFCHCRNDVPKQKLNKLHLIRADVLRPHHLRREGQKEFPMTEEFIKDMNNRAMSARNLSGRKLDKAILDFFNDFNSTINHCIGKYPTFCKGELESVAMTAIWESIKNFDPNKGDFPNYLNKSIRLAITNAVSKSNGLVHIPDSWMANTRKVDRAEEELAKKGCRNATVEDIMHITGLERKDVEQAKMISATVQNIASLDAPLSSADGESLCLGDTVAYNEKGFDFDEEYIKKALKDAIESLSEKERAVYTMYKGFNSKPASNKEIMRDLGMSEPTVIKYKRQAEEKVRAAVSGLVLSR